MLLLICTIDCNWLPRGLMYGRRVEHAFSGVHNCRQFLDRALAPEVMFCYLSG
jgi:hypothetical protein